MTDKQKKSVKIICYVHFFHGTYFSEWTFGEITNSEIKKKSGGKIVGNLKKKEI